MMSPSEYRNTTPTTSSSSSTTVSFEMEQAQLKNNQQYIINVSQNEDLNSTVTKDKNETAIVLVETEDEQQQQQQQNNNDRADEDSMMASRLKQHFINLIDFMSDSNTHGMDLFESEKHSQAMKQYQNIIDTSLETMNLWMSSSTSQDDDDDLMLQTGNPNTDDMDINNKYYNYNNFLHTTGLAEPIIIRKTTRLLQQKGDDNASASCYNENSLRCWIMCSAVAAIHNSALILVRLNHLVDAEEQISNALNLWEESVSTYSLEEQKVLLFSNQHCTRMIMSLYFIRAKIHITLYVMSIAQRNMSYQEKKEFIALQQQLQGEPSDHQNHVMSNHQDGSHLSIKNDYAEEEDDAAAADANLKECHIVQAVNDLTLAYEVGQQMIAAAASLSSESQDNVVVSSCFYQLFPSRVLSWLGFCLLMLGRDQCDLIMEMYQRAVVCYNRIDHEDGDRNQGNTLLCSSDDSEFILATTSSRKTVTGNHTATTYENAPAA